MRPVPGMPTLEDFTAIDIRAMQKRRDAEYLLFLNDLASGLGAAGVHLCDDFGREVGLPITGSMRLGVIATDPAYGEARYVGAIAPHPKPESWVLVTFGLKNLQTMAKVGEYVAEQYGQGVEIHLQTSDSRKVI